MKARLWILLLCALMQSPVAKGQGTLVYDQQSTTTTFFGHSGAPIMSNQPIGQSFTPSLNAVGFVQFGFLDFPQNGLDATVFVNLRANSITGAVLAATSPVSIFDGFFGVKTFLFPNQVEVEPITRYYLRPVVQSGDLAVAVLGDGVSYARGMAYFQGAPHPSDIDLGFREGIVVPEPGGLTLAATFGGILLIGHARRRGGAHKQIG